MEIRKVKLVYFSPTGTTQKVLEGIAQGIAVDAVEHINVTLPEGAQRAIPPFTEELVLIGAPVYGGRLPVEAVNRFRQLKAGKTLVVPIVVYGNRAFEDALLELKNLAVELGFLPVAGAAFIGEHSFASQDVPIANGRPDSRDVRKAVAFGEKIREKVTALRSVAAQGDVEIPGRFPYEGGIRPLAVAPVTEDSLCTACGACADVCPTAAISINGSVTTQVDLCIRCCACIKSCPTGARVWEDSRVKDIAAWLQENCAARKEPEFFGMDDM
jgi:ferredoxin